MMCGCDAHRVLLPAGLDYKLIILMPASRREMKLTTAIEHSIVKFRPL